MEGSEQGDRGLTWVLQDSLGSSAAGGGGTAGGRGQHQSA